MKALLKGLYKLLPFKKEVFSAVKKFWTPPESIYRHLHFTGILTIPVDATHSFKIKHFGYELENHLFWSGIKGRWERYSIDIWIKLSSRANVIFDIGANTGVYSLITKAINPAAHVYAFEPVNRVYQKLVYNSNLNNFSIQCIDKALSNTVGTAMIYDDDSDHEYGASLNKQRSERFATQATEIQTITLDRFIEENNIASIDLMKIDVEHYEPEVLEGFTKYLSQLKPSLLIEILSDETGRRVQKLVEGLGYLYFSINEQEGLKRKESIAKSDGFNYLLCSQATAVSLQLL